MSDVTGIVSHDAGGAQLLSFWAMAEQRKYLICAQGPANLIFNGIV